MREARKQNERMDGWVEEVQRKEQGNKEDDEEGA